MLLVQKCREVLGASSRGDESENGPIHPMDRLEGKLKERRIPKDLVRC
jgi:hypothetical protein